MLEDGWVVKIVAEGLSLKTWGDLGFGDILASNQEEIAPQLFLNEMHPDLVILGESSPTNQEKLYGLASNRAGIPVVFLEDFWNGFTRLNPVVPDGILAADDLAARIAREKYPNANVVVVGHSTNYEADVPQELKLAMDELRDRHGGPVVVYGGQIAVTDLDLLVACMQVTPGCIIPCFHPKLVDALHEETGRPKMHFWKRSLEPLGDRVIMKEAVPGLASATLPQLVAAADITASGYSSVLMMAAANNKLAVSLWNEEVKKNLLLESGLDRVPHVDLGLAVQVEDPINLCELAKSQHSGRSIPPYDADAAYEGIKACIR